MLKTRGVVEGKVRVRHQLLLDLANGILIPKTLGTFQLGFQTCFDIITHALIAYIIDTPISTHPMHIHLQRIQAVHGGDEQGFLLLATEGNVSRPVLWNRDMQNFLSRRIENRNPIPG